LVVQGFSHCVSDAKSNRSGESLLLQTRSEWGQAAITEGLRKPPCGAQPCTSAATSPSPSLRVAARPAALRAGCPLSPLRPAVPSAAMPSPNGAQSPARLPAGRARCPQHSSCPGTSAAGRRRASGCHRPRHRRPGRGSWREPSCQPASCRKKIINLWDGVA